MTDMPAVLMPDFWPNEAALWFRLLETQFSYCKITNQFTRFAILTPYLTEEVAVQVSDALIRPSAETPYDDLKNAILPRLQPPKAGSATKLLPQHPAVFQSSPSLQAQSSSRPVAIPIRSNLVFHKAQIPAYTSTEEVKFMCVEEFAEFPEPTTCIISTVKPCQFHEPQVVSTAVSTDSVQLQSSYRLAAVHDPCYTSASDVEFMCAEEHEGFLEPTSCISSIVRPIRLHEPSIAQPTIQAPTEVFQLCPLVTRGQTTAFCRMT